MDLSDNDKALIAEHIARGEPLPDRFRWLLFAEPREAELIWPGKTSEVTNVVLPFQSIEQIDEPRAETSGQVGDLFQMGAGGRQGGGWSNKLIWGDNKLVLASLKGGPLRREIEAAGGLKLVYIDPPFDVGADFSFDVKIGDDDSVTKEASVIEELAYRDTWGRGADSFLSMIYERLSLIHGLMHESGQIFVHCDWHINHGIRYVLDDIFGPQNFINEIIWYYYNKLHDSRKKLLPRAHDTIFRYGKHIGDHHHLQLKEIRDKPVKKLKYKKVNGEIQNIIGEDGKAVTYISDDRNIDDVWRIRCLQPANQQEWLDYDTQKPQDFIERILETGSKPGDLVADFFSGSGTTLARLIQQSVPKWLAGVA